MHLILGIIGIIYLLHELCMLLYCTIGLNYHLACCIITIELSRQHRLLDMPVIGQRLPLVLYHLLPLLSLHALAVHGRSTRTRRS